MARMDLQSRSRPVAIAPAPPHRTSTIDTALMPYACQTCAKRKVKCDKTSPSCSGCLKGKLECLYRMPQPRYRKRKLDGNLCQKLARYEHILQQHGLMEAATSPSAGETLPSQEPVSFRWVDPETSRNGKLLIGQGKSRYIYSNFWRNLEDDEIQRLSDEDDEDDRAVSDFASDPLTGAFMGHQQSLLTYYPTHTQAMILWEIHLENVEPLCKILHIPSTHKMIQMASQQPAIVSKTDECLLFAIYHFAVFSVTEEECVEKLGQSRATLMQRYHFAARQALANASFLKTTEISVLQSLVLFLLPCRYFYDSHTYWILTGVAVRIAQRMGLHRDGEKLGLSPFDVQMRRRLFYQILPLDGNASVLSGTGISVMPDAWDTQPPLNVNDDQIWPGMTEMPQEQIGATDMIFCLSRACIGRFFTKATKPADDAAPWQFKDFPDAELAISDAERQVEEKYIRYCDIVNPLHFLTIALARSGITAMRLRVKLPKVRNQTATKAEMKELFHLAQKIMDTDAATCTNTGLKKYRWHVRPFFLWGLWDSMIFVLTNLWKRPNLLLPTETESAWSRVEQVYNNHDELLKSRRTLHVAFGRLTLKAWDTHHLPSRGVLEPAFITTLRSQRERKRHCSSASPLDRNKDAIVSFVEPFPASDTNASSDTPSVGVDLDIDSDFSLTAADWMFWDQLIRDYQTQDDS
ncbi:C6 transcription factor domain-containing protein [Penicillium lagena]|uniref:C6 transcription factor domain-containing protein n=1 Tax=Penicillium lagena TaxID=94218 RepID=UPI0025415941|nr:C6 transcription factor domain-containing protein [Penicillium lagena]KAJ5605788.1 C6 transcription factor domain-containing protein [Penicillium lagena]